MTVKAFQAFCSRVSLDESVQHVGIVRDCRGTLMALLQVRDEVESRVSLETSSWPTARLRAPTVIATMLHDAAFRAEQRAADVLKRAASLRKTANGVLNA